MTDVLEPLPPLEGLLVASGSTSEPEARFRSLVELNFAWIWRVLRGLGVPAHAVDDAAQQVFVVAAQKLAAIPEGNERAFLFGTARRVAANARRARSRNREVQDERALEVQADSAPNGEELVELRERRALLDRVLGEMQEDLRVVFVLFVLEGLTTAAVADLLGIAPGTVASRLRRARESFHEIARRTQARLARGGKP